MATPAMSSGRPMRRRGQRRTISSPNVSSDASVILLGKNPGATALTVTWRGASSRASDRVRWWTAALLAE